jgi:hypothetical protein
MALEPSTCEEQHIKKGHTGLGLPNILPRALALTGEGCLPTTLATITSTEAVSVTSAFESLDPCTRP